MDLLRKRLEIMDIIDVDQETQMNNTRELLRVCFKRCGNFQRKELSQQEETCFTNCSHMLFNDFLKKYYHK